MVFRTSEKMVEFITKSLPYSNQITDWDFSHDDHIRFTWRDDRFRVTCDNFIVEQVTGNVLIGSNITILIQEIFRRELVDEERKMINNG